ncbi:MAG: AsmA-like C-terminal region-containing protein, partial [Tangfeifania sp.]
EGIETSGTATITGEATGYYTGENYPAFQLDMAVENGNLHYADLPEEIRNISASVEVSKPQGELNLTEVNVENAHAEVKNNPVDFSLFMNNLVADPYFDGSLKGKIDFNDLKDALPMDSVYIAGLIDADIKASGNYSAIENENYANINSDGTVLLSEFVYDSPKLTQQVLIPGGRLEFSPRDVTLSEFAVKIGQSDFNLRGSVSNYLGYYLTDGTLTGNLNLNSPLVNLNELLRLLAKIEKREEEIEPETLAFDIPGDIDVAFRSEIQRVLYDRLTITNVNGLITAQNGKLVLDGLNMQMLDGTLQLTGSYQNTPENQPFFDFGLDANGFDIPEAYKTLTGFRKMIPVAGQSQGEINTNLKVSGRMSPAFSLIGPTIDGQGAFGTENLKIVGSPVFNELKGILKAEKLNNVSVDDFRASITIEDGGIRIKPFTTKIAGQETAVSGNINTENLVDMQLDFQVEREAFGPDIQSILNVLPGEERIKIIPASVLVQGPVGEARVKINLDEARKKITEEVKKSTKEDLQKSFDKLGKGLKDLFK